MFAIEKGQLHFWVLDTEEKLLIVPDLNTIIIPREWLFVIRDSLTLLANYRIKKVNPQNKEKALEQYLIQKGWEVLRLCSQMAVSASGELSFS